MTDIILSNTVVWAKFGIKEKLTLHILEEIYIRLQPTIQTVIDGKQIIEIPFDFHKEYYKVSIPFKDFKDISHHYDRLERSVSEIQGIRIEFPETREEVFNQKLKRRFIYTKRRDNFCARTVVKKETMPTEGGGEILISKTAEFYFTHTQLVNLLNVRQNKIGEPKDYTIWNNRPTRKTRNKYSPRMHHLLTSMKHGYKKKETFECWKELVGVKGERIEDEKKITFDYYTHWAAFERSVLIPMQKELDTGDITFTYNIEKKGKEIFITITCIKKAV